MSILPLVVSLLGAAPPAPAAPPSAYLTVAESSGSRATATHAQVMELLERLDTESDVMHLIEAGRTVEGRAIPLAVLADPPLTTPEDAQLAANLTPEDAAELARHWMLQRDSRLAKDLLPETVESEHAPDQDFVDPNLLANNPGRKTARNGSE